ncbi:thiamine pyrophosphate-dependent dehydrogenase E1 component subunit alpha [Pseudoclavibacter chungangensis]|uniref:thiamine pyrophosphate-dependent dehydrogenase E1 component subunit alpha n=1 Tax=Pseudoclavibacter chungangensis TaxID=587635 RepID=UPI001CE3CF86|nr:thiamine pyrophosphate-dependent dehydrogenase E1 component subunit alpha [Pseudoclavibacter chungangensis]
MTLSDDTVQILTPDGEVRPNAAAGPFLAALDELTLDDYQRAYHDMTFVRAFDHEGTNLQRQGQLALYVPAEGQEAAQIGSAFALRPQDVAFPSYREHGVAFVRGVDLTRVLALLRGVTHGGWDPEEFRFRLYTLVIGSQTLHATGYAMGQLFDEVVGTGDPSRDEATIVYFGDGATSQGDTNEAFVFANSYRTPQVFFLQNNQWAISVPVRVQSRTPLYKRAAGFGMPSTQIDGNDVMAAYAVTRTSLDAARAGEGPSFIEAMTYRIGAHTTSDDPTKYRADEETASWRERDPILRLERYLRAQGVGDEFFERVADEAKTYALGIREACLALGTPDRSLVFENVYAEPHALVEHEHAWSDRYEASFGEDAK